MVKTKVVDLGKIYALFSTDLGETTSFRKSLPQLQAKHLNEQIIHFEEIIDCLVNLGTWFSLYRFHL